MNVLVWQWGRFGGPPKVAALLAEGLRAVPGVSVTLSLSAQAEILQGRAPPVCELPVDTYDGLGGFIRRVLSAPFAIRGLARRIKTYAPDLAICAQPGPLDLLMAAALRRLGIPFVVLVHDADHHPGDGLPLQMGLQRLLCRTADAVGALSTHVGARLREQGLAGPGPRPLIQLSLPPMGFAVPPPSGHDGPRRVLFFGRLLPYKGIDLLAEALAALGPRDDLAVRVVGQGPESPTLDALRALPSVSVENRWVPEGEVGTLLAWSDALVLPYREASQSGVAAVALAAGRPVVATKVGGLAEQLGNEAGAILCDPTPGDLAVALDRFLASPRNGAPIVGNPDAAWRDMAESLLRQAAWMSRPA